MRSNSWLFWQPLHDYLRLLSRRHWGRLIIIFFNYVIWIYLFYVSFLLIKKDINVFWQVLVATLLSEFVEKIIKKRVYWRRPMFERRDTTPVGLVDKWYKTGSFPSGHTIKAAYFLCFVLTSQAIPTPYFLAIISPLIIFRIIIGFHYPIDIIGGFFIGVILWVPSHLVHFPAFLNQLTQIIFNFVFFIK
jgi:membrane-associated phospholipid phosphatase